jgi:spore germination protein YaaH
LTHVVHGYHPYWIDDATADSYRWDLLTHLAYFSYEVDPATGEAVTVRDWHTSTVIDRAKAEGVRVLLVVTNFGAANNRSILSSTTARALLIERVVALLRQRGAHGVNIDFESVPGDQRGNLVAFFAELRARLDADLPGGVITTAVPAVDWNAAWDVAALAASIDLFFVMGYDYSWSGSSEAGPVAPIRGMNYNVERSLRWYLDAGVPASKLLLGVPYYGYDWPVVSDAPRAVATDRATARTYSVVASWLPGRTRQWSEPYLNPWIAYQGSSWRQVWYDDAESLGHKYQLAKDLGLAGIGMWALGYDAGIPELWELIARMFSLPASVRTPIATERNLTVWPQPLRRGETACLRGGDGFGSGRTSTTLMLHDLLGRRIAELPVRMISETELRFQLPDVAPGVYVATIGAWRARVVVSAR